jgi:hypothetical protein
MGEIHCLYSCHLCGLHRVGCNVPERRDDQDVVEWTREVMTPALCRDHGRHSPNCHPKVFDEVMIPVEGTDRIGAKPRH